MDLRAFLASLPVFPLVLACAQPEAGHGFASEEPGLVLESDTVDLGRIPARKLREVSFPFHVGPDSPVTILEILPERAHAYVELLDAPDGEERRLMIPPCTLAAGAEGRIVTRVSPRRWGEHLHELELVTDASEEPLVLRFHSEVYRPFDLDPGYLNFGDLGVQELRDAPPPVLETVVTSGVGPWEVRAWTHVPDWLSTPAVSAADAAADGTVPRRVEVSLSGPLAVGSYQGRLVCETTTGHELEWIVGARVLGRYAVSPIERLSFGIRDAGTRRVRRVEVRPREPGLVLPKPTVEPTGSLAPHLRIEVRPLGSDGYEIVAELPASTPAGAYTGALRIEFPESSGLDPHELVVTARVRP